MISIIIPVYNVEKYLVRCLDSVVNQTVQPFEVIIIDDGSTDNSKDICKRYSTKYNYISYYRKKNGGLSDARNYGIDKSNGEYVMFLDSDDSIETNSVELIKKKIESLNITIDILVGNGKRIENNEIIEMKNFYNNGRIISGQNFYYNSIINDIYNPTSWLYIYKRDFLTNNDLYFKKGIYHEDEEHTPRALLKAINVLTTDIFFYNYFIREGSITTNLSNIQIRYNDMVTTYQTILRLIKELNDRELLLEYQNAWLNTFLEYNYIYYRLDQFTIKKDIIKKIDGKKRNLIRKKIFLFSPTLYFKIVDYKRKK